MDNPDISKNFNFQECEPRLYENWKKQDYFSSKPDDRKPFTIVIPPPNVTGVLHMGHFLNNTIQDLLIRRARKSGFNACWVPGTDHASIATEAKVVARLKEKGLNKREIGRENFLKHAFEWKDEFGGKILHQLQRLGASCDWNRTRFTMDEAYYKDVIEAFVSLYDKGLIFRDYRMINWDPKAQTALSNEEVIFEERQDNLYYVLYDLQGSSEQLTIATTRPETIMGDTAICVNPKDSRYSKFIGKTAIVPLVNRGIPIIADPYVDMEFGTGCLKVTPAHDPNDYDLGKKHQLETIDILNPDGTLNALAKICVGMDREEARTEIVKKLKSENRVAKIEQLRHNVGLSERTKVVVEPRLSLQWFMRMDKMANDALKTVQNEEVKFFPKKFENMFRHWMENIHDWCISRQLWWGQRIPAYFFGEGDDDFVVAVDKPSALTKAQEKTGNPNLLLEDLKQEEDVLDTWASSWLWPSAVFPKEERDYYYPGSVLVTGWDIIFFWVARMIMAGNELKGQKPFDAVYFTGMLRDAKRRKLSKSLGNSPDALELLNSYGADAVRCAVMLSAPAGNDIVWSEDLLSQGRNFCNKIWNAMKLLRSFNPVDRPVENHEQFAIDWLKAKWNKVKDENENHYETFRLQDVLMNLYRFAWDDFASWFLEFIKTSDNSQSATLLDETKEIFSDLMNHLNPFMPFITEEVWNQINADSDDLIVIPLTASAPFDENKIQLGDRLQEFITKAREVRAKLQLKNTETVELFFKEKEGSAFSSLEPLVKKLCRAKDFKGLKEVPESALAFLADKQSYFLLTDREIDQDDQKEKLEEELSYYRGFLISVEKKLSNEKFVKGAPEAVVQKEQQKKDDAIQKIKVLEESLAKF